MDGVFPHMPETRKAETVRPGGLHTEDHLSLWGRVSLLYFQPKVPFWDQKLFDLTSDLLTLLKALLLCLHKLTLILSPPKGLDFFLNNHFFKAPGRTLGKVSDTFHDRCS